MMFKELFIALIGFIFSIPTIFGGEVAIVLSRNIQPYIQASDGAKKKLQEYNKLYTDILLKDLDKDTLARYSEFITIGSEATELIHNFIQEQGQKNIKHIFCLVPKNLITPYFKTSHTLTQGIITDIPISDKIEYAKQFFDSSLKTCGYLYNSTEPKSIEYMTVVQREMKKKNLEFIFIDISQYASLSEAINHLLKKDIELVWTEPDKEIAQPMIIRTLLLQCLRTKIPIFGFSLPVVKAGAILGFTIDLENQGKRAANLLYLSSKRSMKKSFFQYAQGIPIYNHIVSEILSLKHLKKNIFLYKDLIIVQE